MQIKHFDIDLNIGETPYFQVDNSKRVRFLLSCLEDNPGLLKRIFDGIFKGNSSVDCTFLSAYETNGVIQRENLRRLGRFFKIKNWKEDKLWNDDLECFVMYTTVTNLPTSSLYKYILALMKGTGGLFICFYNNRYLLYVNSDVLDIVSSEARIVELKSDFSVYFDTLYEE